MTLSEDLEDLDDVKTCDVRKDSDKGMVLLFFPLLRAFLTGLPYPLPYSICQDEDYDVMIVRSTIPPKAPVKKDHKFYEVSRHLIPHYRPHTDFSNLLLLHYCFFSPASGWRLPRGGVV